MKLTTFSRLAPSFYKSRKSIYLKGAPGRGKTTAVIDSVAQIATSTGKNLGLVVVNGPNLGFGDTVGFGLPKHNADGSADMIFSRPFFFRTDEGKLLSEYDGGVVFIDEADKIDTDVKKVVGEMALSGRCGPHKLPPGWVVWMAGNRSIDRSGSTKELDHLINRRFEIEVTDDLAGWEQWALRHGVHHTIIGFAMQNPHIVFPETLPEKQGPFCTPRSLVATGELLVTLGGSEPGDKNAVIPTDTDAVEVAAAGIGQAAAAQLFATIRLDAELPRMETIIANPALAKLPGAPDAQMLVAYKLAALADERTLEPIIKYVERLPADFSVTFAKALCTRVPAFVAKPAMLDWSKRNSSLMAVMAVLK
jgi:hypothetical protein